MFKRKRRNHMRLAIIGLGRMGANMARRLMQDGHEVVVHNRSREPIDELASEGAIAAYSFDEIVQQLESPRVVWLMVPAGDPVDQQIAELVPLLDKGDIIVDGGNSRFLDTLARTEKLQAEGIEYVDAGTSGGIWGLELGFNMMVGGSDDAFAVVEPAIASLAPENGYKHVGPTGAGHYVKMVHNGIEYGIMQAYAEGFEILEKSRFDLDLHGIADLWNHGSVIRSWLLELAAAAFEEDPKLEELTGWVSDSGEGRWTVEEAIALDVPAPTIYMALASRFYSRDDNAFSHRVLAALRNQFGGHAVRKTNVRQVDE
ncbi:MAG: decarboxylating 6-phosphogluconate dehydrogenase [Thermomicrobiales bacterium]